MPNTFIPDVSQPTQYEDEKCEMDAQAEKKGESEGDKYKHKHIPELILDKDALDSEKLFFLPALTTMLATSVCTI